MNRPVPSSPVRRRSGRARGPLAAAVLCGLVAAAVALGGPSGPRTARTVAAAAPPVFESLLWPPAAVLGSPRRERHPGPVPDPASLRAAGRFAGAREGIVSFAVVDSRGRLHGREPDRLYPAASVAKAILLAAELERLDAGGHSIDAATLGLLEAMIRYSDNEAADSIYARVGDRGVLSVARRTGMNGLEIAGHWGNASISAVGAARFFAGLDRALPRRYREYGKQLLGSVIASQSWGVPAAAGDRWRVRFKGGWLPDKALVHQAAELRERGGERELSIAVLTDRQPSFGYGVDTVRGVAERLLDRAGARTPSRPGA